MEHEIGKYVQLMESYENDESVSDELEQEEVVEQDNHEENHPDEEQEEQQLTEGEYGDEEDSASLPEDMKAALEEDDSFDVKSCGDNAFMVEGAESGYCYGYHIDESVAERHATSLNES